MRYLLDTNICVALIRQKPPTVLQRLAAYQIDEIVISTVTIAELQFGVQKSTNPHKNQQLLNQFLLNFNYLNFDEASASMYGQVRSYLESRGTPIGALDTMLAAQALAYNLIMVTNNTGEFNRVPNLTLEDWFN